MQHQLLESFWLCMHKKYAQPISEFFYPVEFPQNMSDGEEEKNEQQGQAMSNFKIFQSAQIAEFSPEIHQFNEWKERLEIHFLDVDADNEKSQKSALLKNLGTQAYKLLRALAHPKLPSELTYKELCSSLEKHFMPPTIIFRERAIFSNASKHFDESVSDWFARVKALALRCKFSNLDEAIRDRFIIGMMANDERIFDKLCEEDEKLTADSAFTKALIHETKSKSKVSTEVNFIRSQGQRDSRAPAGYSNNNNNTKAANGNQTKREPCKHCGWKSHKSAACKYKEAICAQCGRKGHLKQTKREEF